MAVSSRPITILIALIVGVLFGCSRFVSSPRDPDANQPLIVYCAAGIRLPVEEAARRYEVEFGKSIQIDYGSSGELEGRLEIDRRSGKSRCDLYIPADVSFSQRTQQKGLTVESLPLASFRLVLGVKPDTDAEFQRVNELLQSRMNYVVCDPAAGAGKKTMKALQPHGLWQTVDANKKATFPRVTEAANAVKTAAGIDAGFVWDTTAKQFGLKALHLQELQEAVSTVGANVVADSKQPTEALRFARYLSAVDRGQSSFEKHSFVPAGTDRWHEKPEIVLYCGGVNRNAIDKTLREFESREGVAVKEQYAGCGTLVTGIHSIAGGHSKKGMPDAFMTCDASYMNMVQEHFDSPSDVSSTQVVMLVRKGNPHGIKTVSDLGKPGLAIGTTDPKMSTLGHLSWQMFELEGIQDDLERNQTVMVMTPTAHELIMQIAGHDRLDVALVFEANCQNLSGDFEIVPIGHQLATAVQNIATARDTHYPELAKRLVRAIQSSTSQKRFELQGFQWRVQTASL